MEQQNSAKAVMDPPMEHLSFNQVGGWHLQTTTLLPTPEEEDLADDLQDDPWNLGTQPPQRPCHPNCLIPFKFKSTLESFKSLLFHKSTMESLLNLQPVPDDDVDDIDIVDNLMTVNNRSLLEASPEDEVPLDTFRSGFYPDLNRSLAKINGTYFGGGGLSNLADIQMVLRTFKASVKESGTENDGIFYSLVITFAVFILFGILGNLLIVGAVLSKESMRTARNVFIVTLAISDLFLCVFTMPTILWEVSVWGLLFLEGIFPQGIEIHFYNHPS